MAKLFIEDLSLRDKKVLTRVDYNVPLDPEGHIYDDTRIRATLPTIQYILAQGGIPILMSHLGRPKHHRSPELSLKSIAATLAQLLNRPVSFASDCVGEPATKAVSQLKPGDVLLLENLRFHRAEEHPEDDPSFARELASYGDLYIDDAFGAAHRKHSSIVSLPSYFPGKSAAGYLLAQEIHFLGDLLKNPSRPFYAILGGAKISSKIGVIQSLLERVDRLLLGGGMAYTFLKAQGIAIGDSLVDPKFLDQARQLLNTYPNKITLPIDCIAATTCTETAATQVVALDPHQDGIATGYQGCDMGPGTIRLYQEILRSGKTVVWNGPLGVYEVPSFARGTYEIAKTLASLTATTVIGGGDLIAAVTQAGVQTHITHISTGGGATLEYLQYGTLPGIEALSEKQVSQ